MVRNALFILVLIFKVGNSIIGFPTESIVFCDRKIDSILKMIKSIVFKIDDSESTPSIFEKERRSTWAIRSFGIKRGNTVENILNIRIFLDRIDRFFVFYNWWDRFDHSRFFLAIEKIARSKIERSNSQLCIYICTTCYGFVKWLTLVIICLK